MLVDFVRDVVGVEFPALRARGRETGAVVVHPAVRGTPQFDVEARVATLHKRSVANDDSQFGVR